MKKILISIVLLIFTTLTLTSCTKSDLTINITKSGGTIAYKYYIDKKIADEYFGVTLPEGLKNCHIDEIDGRIYYVYSETFIAESFDDLENKLCDIKLYGEHDMNLFSSASINDRSLNLTIKSCITEDIKNIAIVQGVDINEVTKISLTVKMPYEIEQYSEGYLAHDKKTLSLEISNFDIVRSIELKCITESIPHQEKTPSKLPLIISIILLTLVIIGVITALSIFLINRRKQKRAEAMPDTPIDKI